MVGIARSQVFCRFTSTAAGASKAFRVPDGYTALVKSAQYQNWGGAAATCLVIISTQPLGLGMYVADTPMPAGSAASVDLWVVLGSGDSVQAYASGGSCNLWVSGALLQGPLQFPPADGAGLLSEIGFDLVAPLPV